jgi:hypothetical protein
MDLVRSSRTGSVGADEIEPVALRPAQCAALGCVALNYADAHLPLSAGRSRNCLY